MIKEIFKSYAKTVIEKKVIILTNEITLRIRYKPNSKVTEVSIRVDENNLTCEVLAWKLAEVATSQYLKYLGGTKDKNFERRYKLGQFKMIRNYLEAKI
jgi:hypothetical protein